MSAMSGLGTLKPNGRLVVALVLLLTAAAVVMLWGLNQRSQDELREQVIERAAQRSVQLADAMAGQVSAELALMDHTLMDARAAWQENPTVLDSMFHKLDFLPDGLVLDMGMVNAEGRVTYNTSGEGVGLDISEQSHFKAMRSGADGMVIGKPVRIGAGGDWVIPVGRPLYREGRFAGAVYLLVLAEGVGLRLAKLALAKDDIVVLLKPDGHILARSVNNDAAMGQVVPNDRPYLQNMTGRSGTYWQNGTVDNVSRIYGWYRMQGSGLLLVVGLAESAVMAPVNASLQRSRWITGVLSALLLAGGSVVAWLIWRDGRSTQVIRESEQMLKDAQRLSKLAYIRLDFRKGEAVWSDEMRRIYGYDPGDPKLKVTDPEVVYDRVHPDDLPAIRAASNTALQNCASVEFMHRVVLPSGAVKHVRVMCSFEGENGKVVSGNVSAQDITELRVAQLALEDMNEKLEARVEARTRELASLNKELEAFTYSVSHDLRTPLRSIHGFATLLEDESDRLSEEGRTHLRRIQDGARRMGLLITDLLTMAHQSRAVVNVQQTDLSELAQAVSQDIAREDPLREVGWRIEPGLTAWADPVLMRVVLQNLLGNAWKYTSQVAQAEIVFEKVGQANDMTEFCVRDNGAGFDMVYVDQLFQPFKRLHAHHEFEGTGVGLASVHRLVQRHGGAVRAEGKVGQGAAIYFSLPDDPAVVENFAG
jgi:signal transduction histidine kinase